MHRVYTSPVVSDPFLVCLLCCHSGTEQTPHPSDFGPSSAQLPYPHDVTRTTPLRKKKPREEKGHTMKRGTEGRRRAVNSGPITTGEPRGARTISSINPTDRFATSSVEQHAVFQFPSPRGPEIIPSCGRRKTPPAFQLIHHRKAISPPPPQRHEGEKMSCRYPVIPPRCCDPPRILRAPEPPDLHPAKHPPLRLVPHCPLSAMTNQSSGRDNLLFP